MNINLSGHLRRLLHVHIVVEEVLKGGDLAQRLELVLVALLVLARSGGFLRLGLRTDASDTIDRLQLLLGVEWCLPLVIPELPCSLTLMTGLELSSSRRIGQLRWLFLLYCLGCGGAGLSAGLHIGDCPGGCCAAMLWIVACVDLLG